MELTIDKEGNIAFLGKKIGKTTRSLKKVVRIHLIAKSKKEEFPRTINFHVPKELELIGLEIVVSREE